MDRFKHTLRAACRDTRKNLPQDYQQALSYQICTRIQAMSIFQEAKHIALYCASQGEVDLSLLWQSALSQGTLCYFPQINKEKKLFFLPAGTNTPFKDNQYGIKEPFLDESQAIAAQNLDLVFTPLLAFDSHCNRLGRGGGYYDRSFQEGHPMLLGVAYDFQRQIGLNPQDTDVPLTAVITEAHTYWRRQTE